MIIMIIYLESVRNTRMLAKPAPNLLHLDSGCIVSEDTNEAITLE